MSFRSTNWFSNSEFGMRKQPFCDCPCGLSLGFVIEDQSAETKNLMPERFMGWSRTGSVRLIIKSYDAGLDQWPVC